MTLTESNAMAFAAFPANSRQDIKDNDVLWTEVLPGGHHWSWRLQRGRALRCVALDAHVNLSMVIYAAHDPAERYNMPDSVKAQHTAHYTQGHVLMSDMGRSLASVTHDSLGWHDPFGLLLDNARMDAKYGKNTYAMARNGMYRSGKDGLLTEIAKYGLTARDLVVGVNWFSKVSVNAEGGFIYHPEHASVGDFFELRLDMDCIVAVSTAPHPLDTRPAYAPGRVGVLARQVGAAERTDGCRHFRPENARALLNTDLFYA
jgi:urea carboxylase-associated protein 2